MRITSIIAGLAMISLLGCAGKNHDTQLVGIQKQISYLSKSYNNLSLKLGEIQDSLLVLQYKVEAQENGAEIVKKSSKKKKASKKDAVHDGEAQKKAKDAKVTTEQVPIFELGKISNAALHGQEGKVYKLDGDAGYLKVEGQGKNARARIIKLEGSDKERPEGPPETLSPKELYKSGFSYYSKRKFSKAIDTFSRFLKTFPEHDLSDNAVYWIGESYVGQGQYALALPEFQRVPLDYPNGNKVPDALLMIGICFDNMKNNNSARESWQKLVSLFPNTMAAKIAKKKLEGEEDKQ